MDPVQVNLDALLPPAMAAKAEDIGVKKATMAFMPMFILSILAGAFIGMGANFSTIAATGAGALPYGVGRLLAGFVFCLGLILVVIAGAELFTGNNLIIMAVASKKVTVFQLLRNWVIVYVGNFVGSIATAYFVFLSTQYTFGGGAVGETAMRIANAKSGLAFVPAIFLGIYCNALVCLAVWLCFSARTSTDKILCIVFPITAFVAAGFEHSIANMYFLPIGYFVKCAVECAGGDISAFANLNWYNIWINNLIPVTIGNIIGGAGFVGIIYWLTYRSSASK